MKEISRRTMLKGSAAAAAGAGLMSLNGLFGVRMAAAQFSSDIDILNYALTLEHLEYAFYRDGLNTLGVGAFSSFGANVGGYLQAIRDHEGAHVATLISVIQSLGGTPVSEATYNFGYTNAASFLAVAQALENTGVSAYDGAIRFIQSPDLTEAAATIATVEARHASYLNLINGTSPFPAAFDDPKSKDEILAIAGPFIVSAATGGTVNTVAPSGSGSGNAAGNLVITSPTANQIVPAFTSLVINGTASFAPGSARFYKVEISGGQFGNNFVTIGQTRSTGVTNGRLETLGPVAPGSYQLRLVIIGNDSNLAQPAFVVPFTVQ